MFNYIAGLFHKHVKFAADDRAVALGWLIKHDLLGREAEVFFKLTHRRKLHRNVDV